jgi:SAM-dependent methyltransferase
MREWNAETYHRVSDPQWHWGLAVLNRLRLAGDELALDVGCGTGRLTEVLARRLPRGRVIGVDLSANMLAAARQHLDAAAPGRVLLTQADPPLFRSTRLPRQSSARRRSTGCWITRRSFKAFSPRSRQAAAWSRSAAADRTCDA